MQGIIERTTLHSSDRLVLERDCFGEKQLYYYHDEKCFAFASDFQALVTLLKPRVPLSIDANAIPKYLAFGYVPGENSILKGIKRVPPSTLLVFSQASWTITQKTTYWKPEDISANETISVQDAVEKTEQLVRDAVQRSLTGEKPTSVFLSGGVDSSCVLAFAKQLMPEIQAHSITYPDATEANENRYAQKVADALGVILHTHPFTSEAVRPTFENLLARFDEPVADSAQIPLHYLAMQSVADAPIALSGDGGDELFAGYTKYRMQRIAERLPSFIRHIAGRLGKCVPMENIARLLTVLPYPFYARQFLWGSGSPLPAALKKWLPDADWSPEVVFADAAHYDSTWKQRDSINRSLYLDWRILIPDCFMMKNSRATTTGGLRLHAPLLDRELAELAISLPGRIKLEGGSKSILKAVTARYVPKECVYRAKRGFGNPMDKWLRHELRPVIEPLLLETDAPFFDRTLIAQTWDEHLSARTDHRFTLFRIALLHAFWEQLKGIC
jgi:asparagine synthase (glutamine-hydrolysing)